MKVRLKTNFIIAGAPKCGTTSLASYLNQHPEICITKEKEPFYFTPSVVERLEKHDPMYEVIKSKAHLDPSEYNELYEGSGSATYFGDATVHYLYHWEEAIRNIKNELGDVPIIIVIRNPVERAFSNYLYQKRLQLDSFEDSLMQEDVRKERGYNSFWYYKSVGLYSNPISKFKENFSKVFVGLHEDFKANPESFLADITSFIGANAQFKYELSVKHNKTTIPRNKFFHWLMFCKKFVFGNKKVLPKQVMLLVRRLSRVEGDSYMAAGVERSLIEFFKEDVLALEEILGVDLSQWLKVKNQK